MIGVNTRKLLGLIAALVVLSSVFLFVFEADASLTNGTVRIMPLGDSITMGYPGNEGYRKDLYWDLNYSGFNVDFVGSQQSGAGFDNNHEGHIGYYADQIRDDVYGWLVSNPADVVLLHIGTNDINDGQDVAGIVTEVGGILDNIDQWGSDNGRTVTVILARIILRSDNTGWNATTKTYDNALEAMASARIASGDHIIMVDMENALNYSNPSDLGSDGIHPTATGYEKMANVWYNALTHLLGYSLTVNYDGHGSVTKLPDQAFYPYGTVVNLTATADNGWTFSNWSGDLVSSVNPESIEMNSNKTVTATFTQIQYKLTVTANFGTTSPSVGEYWYLAGSTVNLEAFTPATGSDERYNWVGWSGSGSGSYSGTNNSTTITMNGPINESASWTHEYKLTLSTNSGTTTPSTGQHWYPAGTQVTIAASSPSLPADTRAVWAGWTGSGASSYTGTNNSTMITLNGPVNETASWTTEYKLNIATNLGTASPSVGDHWYEVGSSVNVTASPPPADTGIQYVCSGWSGTGSVPTTGDVSSMIFTINAPSNITWTWKTQYYLTVSSAHGTPGGAGWYDADSSAYATVSPTTVDGTGGIQYVFNGWSGNASGSSSPSNAIVMDAPKTAIAGWSTINPPTPTPTPSSSNTPSSTPTPTASSSPSPSPTASASPSASPSSTPTQTPNGSNNSGNNYIVYGAVIAVILVGVIVGVLVFMRFKH